MRGKASLILDLAARWRWAVNITLQKQTWCRGEKRNAPFCVIARRVMVIPCGHFGTTYPSHLQQSRIHPGVHWIQIRVGSRTGLATAGSIKSQAPARIGTAVRLACSEVTKPTTAPRLHCIKAKQIFRRAILCYFLGSLSSQCPFK